MIAGGILMGVGTLSIAYFILYAVLVDLNNAFLADCGNFSPSGRILDISDLSQRT